MPHTQWSSIDEGAAFHAVGNTQPGIEAGLYDIDQVNGVGIVWIPARSRSEKLIRFPDSPSDAVISEIERFWTREEAFVKHGLPFKRGMLLYGPPGSGKTMTLQIIARDVIDSGGVVMMFPGPSLFIGAYRQFRDIQPETPLVVLMEDLDVLLAKGNQSQMLNVLDGAEEMHKVLFLATTNYPERLEARVVNRPSRFDRRIKVPHPGDESRKLYLESLLEPGDEIDVERAAKDTKGLSLAHVKELFVSVVLLGTPYEQAVTAIREMRTENATSLDDEEEQGVPGLAALFGRTTHI